MRKVSSRHEGTIKETNFTEVGHAWMEQCSCLIIFKGTEGKRERYRTTLISLSLLFSAFCSPIERLVSKWKETGWGLRMVIVQHGSFLRFLRSSMLSLFVGGRKSLVSVGGGGGTSDDVSKEISKGWFQRVKSWALRVRSFGVTFFFPFVKCW